MGTASQKPTTSKSVAKNEIKNQSFEQETKRIDSTNVHLARNGTKEETVSSKLIELAQNFGKNNGVFGKDDNLQKNGSPETKGFKIEFNSDITSLKVNRSLLSDPNNPKLPSAQSLQSSISGINSFSFLQNNFNNVNNFVINHPVIAHPKDSNQNNSLFEKVESLNPNRSKTDEPSTKTPVNDFAKHFSELQQIITKNNNLLPKNISDFKATKNLSSPIVLKLHPQFLSTKEASKQENPKLQNKIELKANHKVIREENEDPAPQKKVKSETGNTI